jgi:zinc protease
MIRLTVFLCLAVSLAAQDAPTDKSVPLSKTERKNLAPVSKEILHVKLPKPVEAKLDNGVTVLILEDHRLPSVSAQLLIRGAGGLGDPAGMPGLASTTAAMLKEGTATRSSKQLAEEIDGLGANLNSGTGFGTTEATLSASGLSDNFDRWFALMTDVLLHPTFPDSELQKYKQRQLVGLKQQRTQPTFLASERFSKAVYGSFPAAIVSTTPEAIQALTSEALVKWHRERYAPQNAILAIAGDVDAKQLIPKLNKALADWKRNDFVVTIPPSPTPAAEKKIYLVNRPGSVQTNLVLGNIGIDRRSPDYIAFNVMNRILGGSATGRLFLNLREEKGYTYGAYSSFNATEFAGPWRANAEVRTPVTEGSMTEFLKEFNRIRDEKVPAAELDEAQRSIVAVFALSLEQPAQVLSYAITRKIYDLPGDYWDTYPAKITAIAPDDVMRVAKKYIGIDNLQVVAVGDASKIKSVLEKYGPVTVYGADGKPTP